MINIKMIIAICLCFLISINNYISAQSYKKVSSSNFGIEGNFIFNFNSFDFRQLPNIQDSVPRFANNSNIGYSFGIFWDLPISTKTDFIITGSYNHHQFKVSSEFPSFVYVNSLKQSGVVNHSIETSLSSIYLEPSIKYNFWNRFAFIFGLGIAYRFDDEFYYIEEIKASKNALFNNGSNYNKVNLADTSTTSKFPITLIGGIGYEFPINYNGKYLLDIHLKYSFGYVNPAEHINIDINSLAAGIAIKYSLSPTVNIQYDTIKSYSIDTITKQKDYISDTTFITGDSRIVIDSILSFSKVNITLNYIRTDTIYYNNPKENIIEKSQKIIDTSAKFYIYAIDDNTNLTHKSNNILINEYTKTDYKPLLNYIFFDNNSYTISERYHQISKGDVELYNINDLMDKSILETYYDVLNIIGKRMIDFSESKIKIKGYNSNTNEEANNINLSKQRANTIKDYFINVWNINPKRISISAANLPEKFSNISNQDGIEENRRVEIQSDNFEIISPLIGKSLSHIFIPSKFQFIIDYDSSIIINKKYLVFKINNTLYKKIEINNNYNTFNTNEFLLDSIQNKDNLVAYIELITNNNIVFNSNSILLEINKKKYENTNNLSNNNSYYSNRSFLQYNLILFDYNKAIIDNTNDRFIQLINNKINDSSKVIIEGYTDRTGEASYNLNLSENRARNVANKISIKNITIKTYGNSKELFDNNLPEGRFYCRTVKVLIETTK